MSNTPNYDAKVKLILDTLTPGERTCALTGEKWMLTEEEIRWYRHFNVPPAKFSPLARMRMLMGFNMGIDVWWNTHPETGESMLSYIHPDSPIKAIPDLEWHARDFSGETEKFRADEPFLEQWMKLAKRIPMPALRQYEIPKNTVGVSTMGVEDSFMVFAFNGKRCSYCYLSFDVEDSYDIAFCRAIRDSNSLLRCIKMFSCHDCVESSECMNSAFLFDCRNCEFCFGATNQRNKKYLWFNEQLTKEKWEQRVSETDLSSWSTYCEHRDKFLQMLGASIWPESFNQKSDACTGEYLERCVRVTDGYWLELVSDSLRYWLSVNGDSSQVAYCSGASRCSEIYMCAGIVNSQENKFCTTTQQSIDMEYCMQCVNCEHCFGCVGIRNKKFCILNEQYNEADYWKKVDEVKCAMLDRGEYGSFFPAESSPTGFTLSPTMLFAPFTQQELDTLGVPMLDPSHGNVISSEQAAPQKRIDPVTIPDRLDEIDPSVFVKKAIFDAELGRNWSVHEREFEMYKARHLPFPRRHFRMRTKAMLDLVNKPLFDLRACQSCSKPISVAQNTAFPNRTIYCQACYLNFLETR